jgi:hypothetical protein
MYSIYAANGRFTTSVFRNHLDAFRAFRESKMIGTAFVVNEDDGAVIYDLVSDGEDAWCYRHEFRNSPRRATACLSA